MQCHLNKVETLIFSFFSSSSTPHKVCNMSEMTQAIRVNVLRNGRYLEESLDLISPGGESVLPILLDWEQVSKKVSFCFWKKWSTFVWSGNRFLT